MMEQKEKFAAKGVKTEFVGEAQRDCLAADRVIQGQVNSLNNYVEYVLCNLTNFSIGSASFH